MKKQIIVAVAAVFFSLLVGAINAEDIRLTISRTGVISWPGETGAVYRVFSSTDLREWKEVSTVAMNATGAFKVDMTDGARFYRVEKIQPAKGTLTVANGNMPDGAIVIAGSSGNHMAQFTFSATGKSFAVNKFKLQVPWRFAQSTADITVKYTDKEGVTQMATGVFTCGNDESQPCVATFTGLSFSVLPNGSATIDVFANLVSLAVNGFSGSSGAITLLANEGFQATSDSGDVVTSLGSTDLTGNAFVVRMSKPTFAKLDAGVDPVNGPLYRFSVVADNAGIIEIKRLGFKVSAVDCQVSGLYLYDPNASTVLTDRPVDPQNGNAYLPIGEVNDNDVLIIGATPRIYEVRGTVTGYGDGGTITVEFLWDMASTANGGPITGSVADIASYGNWTVWSDRSAIGHTVFTTDWTNGFLLEGMDGIQTFTK